MSTSYSETVRFTIPGQGPIEDEACEGRIAWHHTSDTAQWETRKVGTEGWVRRFGWNDFGPDTELEAFLKALKIDFTVRGE